MIKEYIDRIVANGKPEDMERLSDIFEDMLEDLKRMDHKKYCDYKMDLHEMVYGKKVNEEMAHKWVENMEPYGEHWTMDQTTSVANRNGINYDPIDWYVVMNMIYNDYHDTIGENDMMYIKLARNWLNDTDAVDNKVYYYYKYIVE